MTDHELNTYRRVRELIQDMLPQNIVLTLSVNVHDGQISRFNVTDYERTNRDVYHDPKSELLAFNAIVGMDRFISFDRDSISSNIFPGETIEVAHNEWSSQYHFRRDPAVIEMLRL